MSDEVLILKWWEYQTHVIETFQQMQKTLCDVTLVCEGNHAIDVHKIILSASSPFLSHLLTDNQTDHPLIYLYGVSLKNLSSIVEFIYHGTTNISKESLDGFISAGEALQLKGLLESVLNLEDKEGIDPKDKINPKSQLKEQNDDRQIKWQMEMQVTNQLCRIKEVDNELKEEEKLVQQTNKLFIPKVIMKQENKFDYEHDSWSSLSQIYVGGELTNIFNLKDYMVLVNVRFLETMLIY